MHTATCIHGGRAAALFNGISDRFSGAQRAGDLNPTGKGLRILGLQVIPERSFSESP
jgi:hypothetical protein